jgi:hypothetical protein
MARRAKTSKTVKLAVTGRKAGHPAAPVKRPTKKAARTAKRAVSTASPKHTPRMGPSLPKLSKDELRAQVEKRPSRTWGPCWPSVAGTDRAERMGA